MKDENSSFSLTDIYLFFVIGLVSFVTLNFLFNLNVYVFFILSIVIAGVFTFSIKNYSKKPIVFFCVFIVIWIIFAFNTVNKQNWIMENVSLALVVLVLIILYLLNIQFSDVSYTSILLLGFLHVIGSHYTYSGVPFGYWLMEQFGFLRNHYDRIVHFLFGLLFFLPLRELFTKTTKNTGIWSYLVPITLISQLSMFYELLEWVSTFLLREEVLPFFLAVQGDAWDAQKDMFVAFIGSCIAAAMALIAPVIRRMFKH